MTGGGWMLMENQCMAVKVDGCIHENNAEHCPCSWR
jgi:hypothetical protein